jgi:hypothetical protein
MRRPNSLRGLISSGTFPILSTIQNMLYTPIYCGMLQHTRICRADRCHWTVVLAI